MLSLNLIHCLEHMDNSICICFCILFQFMYKLTMFQTILTKEMIGLETMSVDTVLS